MTDTRRTRQRGLVGAAGAYLVAARLSIMGYNVATTFRNAAGTDIVAENPRNAKAIVIQVKSRETREPSFLLQGNTKPWEPVPRGRVYVFVILGSERNPMDPRFFTLTGEEVNRHARQQHGPKSWWVLPSEVAEKHEGWSIVGDYLGPPPANLEAGESDT